MKFQKSTLKNKLLRLIKLLKLSALPFSSKLMLILPPMVTTMMAIKTMDLIKTMMILSALQVSEISFKSKSILTLTVRNLSI